MKKSGIYKIRNLVNGKLYIGSSDDIHERWMNHRIMLKNNSHHSKKLQRAYNKYGKENFLFELLEECSIDDLISREQYYLNTLLYANEYINKTSKKFMSLGYNIKPIAGKGSRGLKHTKESIEKMLKSKELYGIYSLDKTGKIEKFFTNTKQAAEYYKITRGVVSRSIYKKQYSRKGICFIYVKDYNENFKPLEIHKWNKNKNIPFSGKKRKVNVYTLYGDFIRSFDDLYQCADYFNTHASNIHKKISTKNKKFLIDSELSKHIILDINEQVNKISDYWNYIFDNLSVVNGNIQCYDCFDNYICNSDTKTISVLLNVSKKSVINSLSTNKRIKTLRLCRI